MLERVSLAGYTVIADKGFAGAEFEQWMADRGAVFLRPIERTRRPRSARWGRIRQIESVFWTCKGQLGLERHGARTLPGLCARIGLRLLALAAGLWHNGQIGEPGRHFTAQSESVSRRGSLIQGSDVMRGIPPSCEAALFAAVSRDVAFAWLGHFRSLRVGAQALLLSTKPGTAADRSPALANQRSRFKRKTAQRLVMTGRT
jgi:hypothetical protein